MSGPQARAGAVVSGQSQARAGAVASGPPDGDATPTPAATRTRRQRARLRQHPERAVTEAAALDAVLQEATVAHVAVSLDGQPVVVPMLFQHEDGVVYLHGAPASRLLRHIASGAEVCLAVTLVDGLVASRSARYHSANFRSVVLFGRGSVVTDIETKRGMLARMTQRLFEGRQAPADYDAAPDRDLRSTLVVAVHIDERTGKRRTGPPLGPTDADGDDPRWCGVVPLHTVRGRSAGENGSTAA